MKQPLIPAATLLLGSIWPAHAAFTAVDNFNARNLGNLVGQGTWVGSTSAVSTVLVDPGNSINKIMRITSASGQAGAGMPLPVPIANGTASSTLFLRVRLNSTTNDTSFGLSDIPATNGGVNTFGNFEVQAPIVGANLRGRDAGLVINSPLNLPTTTWYKIWMVVNTTADTFRIYYKSADEPPANPPTQFVATDGTFNFRNAAAANNIVTLQFTSNSTTASIYFDDVYIDTAAENMADPTFVEDPDTDDDTLEDAWEIFYFTNLTQDADDDTEGGTGDGLTNAEEQAKGTNPTLADTDADGLSDGVEDDGSANTAFGNAPTKPLDADSDDDGATDGQEVTGILNTGFSSAPTDPNLADTDADGIPDYDETVYATNPNSDLSLPTLHTLVGPTKRNGSFELLAGATGSVAGPTHWDTDPAGDIDNWTLWTGVSTAAVGGTDDTMTPSHGIRRTEIEANNAAYNLTPYQAKEGDIIRITWDHLGTSVGTGAHTFWVAYDDGFGTVFQLTPTATLAPAPGGSGKLIYKVPAASGIIGRKIGVGVRATANDQRIDNVVMTVRDSDSDSDGLSDFWEDQYFGNNDENPTPAEIALQSGSGNPDGDGFDNAAEETAGSSPSSNLSTPADTDADGLADSWEIENTGNLTTLLNGSADPDHDFATNEQEETGDSSPITSGEVPDTDSDGLNDGWETHYFSNLDTGDVDSDGDGVINSLEMAAGSHPGNANWTPEKAVLTHRWSFNGSLNDSVGSSHAQILDADANAANGGGSTLSASSVTLAGGASTTSDYISLGSHLLQGKMTPVTLEFWATHNAIQNWGRIFDFNSSTTEYMMMSWTRGTVLGQDSFDWTDTTQSFTNDTVAPYALGTQYHIVVTILPSVNTAGAIGQGSRVTWYAAPAGLNSPLGPMQGTLDVPHHLVTLNDLQNWVGRSIWPGDSTASATYDEIRIWDGAMGATQRAVAQAAGPESANLAADTDTDTLPDAWEMAFFSDLDEAAASDPDSDGQNNLTELAGGSNPNNINSVPGDADGDGLGDTWEFTHFGNFLQTAGADPDGDHDTNLVEFTNSTIPTSKLSFFSSTADTVPDSWKAFYGISAQSSTSDLDEGTGDGITNLVEFQRNTNPTLIDTDADGLSDGVEVNTELTDPLDSDTDNDGLTDGNEVNVRNTEPLLLDTDGDSFGDGYEIAQGSDPLVAGSVPTQPSGFTLLEDFEGPGMVIGQTFGGVNGWVTPIPGNALVAANPSGTGKVGHWLRPAGALRAQIYKSLSATGLQVLQGNTGTVFFQLYCPAATVNHSFGLTDLGTPVAFADFEAQFAAVAANMLVNKAGTNTDTTYDLRFGQWMNVWVVANNSSDLVKVYVESPDLQTGRIEITAPGSPFGFRNGAATNALINFLMVENAVDDVPIWIDNIYVDPKTENSNNPAAGADSDTDGMEDPWEITYFGGLSETATGDFDKDGTDNLTEFRLGLVPNDGKSIFNAIRATNGIITWPSKAGTTFKIERSTTLGVGGWTTLQATYPGTAGTTTYTDPSPPAGGKAFYRITLN